MSGPPYLDLCRQVLDHQLIDCEELPCGTIDEIEVEGGEGGKPPRAVALLVGPGAWGPRLPALFALMAARCLGTRCTRIPWHEIAEVGEQVRLRSRAATLGLGTTDRKLGLLIAKLPGSEKKSK